MFLEEVKLESFKGFRDFVVPLSQVTCLVGLNSGGKTSILQAIRLLGDIVVHAFGNQEQPSFGNPQWNQNPSQALARVSQGDPDAVWLRKKTSEPCAIAAALSGGGEVKLRITGRSQYELDILRNGESLKAAIAQDKPGARDVVSGLFSLRPAYVPPVGAVSPAERFIDHPQVQDHLDKGRESECWRSRIYWLLNDGERESFDEIVALVAQYLPAAKVSAPRLSHESPPRVLVEFEEDGVIFDISTSGGGLRTVLNLATVLRFSGSGCLLLDEPDSHLHGTLQRAAAQMLIDDAAEQNRQIIVATHAPDFLAEFPTESLVWINREEDGGRRCSELGRVLVGLGSVTKADAVRAYGADKILFVEGDLDAKVLGRLLARSGCTNPFEDPKVIRPTLPSGRGDSVHLQPFRRLLREALGVDVSLACVVDNDYDLPLPQEDPTPTPADDWLLKLGVKEAENYLISPPVILGALEQAAAARGQHVGANVVLPTEEEIAAQLDSVLQQPAVRDKVRWQVLPRYRRLLPPNLDESTREEQGEKWFAEQWADPAWRIRNCPGAEVLRAIRTWCKSQYRLNLPLGALVTSLTGCPADLVAVAKRLEACLYGDKEAE